MEAAWFAGKNAPMMEKMVAKAKEAATHSQWKEKKVSGWNGKFPM